jgi:glycyl-tRNA synthetase beta chain
VPELLLELFSEEIPARMQARAAEDLLRLLAREIGVAGLEPAEAKAFAGPRRLTIAAHLPPSTTGEQTEVRGPRAEAPEQAVAGFIAKVGNPLGIDGDTQRQALSDLRAALPVTLTAPAVHGAVGSTVAIEAHDTDKGRFFVAQVTRPARPASEVLATILPYVIRNVPWPKSMRWGGTSAMTWVRPLKRILCVLDGAVVPFDLRAGDDDGHGLVSGDLTEGHRIMAPGAFAVRGLPDYQEGLRERRVVLDADERARLIREGVAALAAAEGLSVVPDDGLVAEVAGLVEWPVPLLGRIDDAFMDLPAEVMRTTMRVNQRYFALRTADGAAAPRFAVVANIEAPDGGAAIVAGNELVLRARLADARFFWDLDRRQSLESFLPKLDSVVFHAKLGTQGQRVARLERLARVIAQKLWPDEAAIATDAARAAKLAKADLASGMVGEFPELQGVMGRYYARAAGEAQRVAEAIGAHYRPLGPQDEVPGEPVAISVALADKLDQLAGFFAVGEKPTGSGDPFALRRAALGVIRIVRENGLRLRLRAVLEAAYPSIRNDIREHHVIEQVKAQQVALRDIRWVASGSGDLPIRGFDDAGLDEVARAARKAWEGDHAASLPAAKALATDLLDFLTDRLRVQLRAEGTRHDVVTAVLGAAPDDDLNRLLRRADAVRLFVESDEGANLLSAHRRAANILRIEEKRDGHTYDTGYEHHLLKAHPEQALAAALEEAAARITLDLDAEDFERAMDAMATLRAPVDAFFDHVIVNDAAPELRRNRLKLLARLRATMDAVADFSKIEA